MTLFAELKRRNVVRVGFAYAVIGWVVAQIAEFAFENFGAPDWVLKTVVVLLLLGLPIVLVFAWAFEITPEGVKREKDVDRSASITSQTGRKLDRTIIVVLVVALAWFAWDKFLAAPTGLESMSTTANNESVEPELEDKSVAVLPFVAMSSGEDDEYFADGLTEEILNSLSQLPELLVTARTSAFSFKGQDIPVQEIATALGVRHIVEGSVRRSGDRLRVTAQLIRAQDGFHLWSENYDSSSTDTIAVQENIAEQIAAALDVVLDEKKRAAMRQAGLRNVEAFTIYQKGIRAYGDAHGEIETIEGLRLANEYFDQVIELVPEFSQVYIDHSDLYIHILAGEASGLYDAEVTRELANTALEIAVSDYEAAGRYTQNREVRRMIELDLAFVNGNWRGIGNRIERALDEPGCYEGNWAPTVAGAFGYSEAYLKRAYDVLACDPRRSLSWFTASRAALQVGKNDEALKIAREGTRIAPGGWLSTALIVALVASGEIDEAKQTAATAFNDRFSALQYGAMIAAHEGNREEYELFIKQLEGEFGDFWGLIFGAWVGDRDQVNERAARIDQHHFAAPTFAQIIQWCKCGAPWDLEATPNFAAKVEESKLPWPPLSIIEFPLKDW